MLANSGVSKLAQVIAERIAGQTARPDALELGTIQADMSLKTDHFEKPIPKGEYLVCRTLTLPNLMTTTNVAGQDAHIHTVIRPEQLSPLKPGDRVLVAWVNGGIDPVVIDVVVSKVVSS